MNLHIAIAGPIATTDIVHLIDGDAAYLPRGYPGAPLLATLIGELLRLGHRVSAFTLSGDMPLGHEKPVVAHGANFTLSYCPMRPRAWRPNGLRPGRILDLYAFERGHLQRAIEQAAPGVVHAHWSYEFALGALQTRLPHVVTCHDSPLKVAHLYGSERPSLSLYRWLRVIMARKALCRARTVTAVSTHIREEVQGMTRVPIAVVPNPVDAFALSLGNARKAPLAPKFAMICNGWQALKNPLPALEAFARFRASHPAATLHLYGQDFGAGQKAELWVRAHGSEQGMVFHGMLPHRQMLLAVSGADLLLHPSLEESFGMAIAEAMAMGLPVVAGRSSGAVPWVVGDGGALCDVLYAQAIYQAMERVLVPDTYARSSRAARARVNAMFTANAVAAAYLETYRAAMHEEVAPC